MLKVKYIFISILVLTTSLMAETLQTSDHLSNLEVVTDNDCNKKKMNAMAQSNEPEQMLPKAHEVETINFTLKGCNGFTSFPVTVRANKRQGE